MKKILSSILVLTLLICCLSISVSAGNQVPARMRIGRITNEAGQAITSAKAGDTIKIEVEVYSNIGLTGADFELSSDAFATHEIVEQGKSGNAPFTQIRKGAWCNEIDEGMFTSSRITGEALWTSPVQNTVESGVIAVYTAELKEDLPAGNITIKLTYYDLADNDSDRHLKNETGNAAYDSKTLEVTSTQPPIPPVKEKADLTALNAAITAAEALKKDDYKDFSAVETALAEAKNLAARADELTTDDQATVDAAAAKLNAAVNDLEVNPPVPGKADLSKLNAAIKAAEKLKKDDYKDFSAVEKALTAAKELAAKEGLTSADQDAIDTATKNLEDAVKNLKNKDNNKKDETAKTSDNTNLYIYMAICLFAAAVIVVASYKVKKNRG